MIKYFCDACGKEINGKQYSLPILCHIKNDNPFDGYAIFKDNEMIPVSGREEHHMFCIKCYNEIMFPLWENIKQIQKRNENH